MDWDEEGVMTMTGSSSFLSYTLTGLQRFTDYEARVLSINFNGPSDFSDMAQFGTVGECVGSGVCSTLYFACKFIRCHSLTYMYTYPHTLCYCNMSWLRFLNAPHVCREDQSGV